MSGRLKNRLVIVVCFVLLAACVGHSTAPISSRKAPPSEKILSYRVSKGDTLFSIAWRNEIDIKTLAAINNISPPYIIYPGQWLSLDTTKARRVDSNPRVIASSRTKSGASSSRHKPVASSRTGSVPAVASSRNTPKTTPQTVPQRGKTQGSKAHESKAQQNKRTLPGRVSWQWPVKGRVSRKFGSDKLFKGIDIASLPGAPVYPAADGIVVYAGTGLRGYGSLIIVKHSSVFLSAYAHNRKILVKEGQSVNRKQKIGEVGGDPANVRRFYFEIRKDGKPVNPLIYLK